MQTSFLLADNQDITRIGIQTLLSQLGLNAYPIAAVYDASELETALQSAEAPIVIIDTETFEISEPQKLLALYEKQPMTRWLLFQDEFNDSQLSVYAGMPSVSMLLKSCTEEEIRVALKCIAHAERYVCHTISNRLLSRRQKEEDASLTQSEADILKWIALGKTVKEIAAIRFSSTHTIVTHKKNIFRKIGVNSVYEATRYAIRVGLIGSDYYI